MSIPLEEDAYWEQLRQGDREGLFGLYELFHADLLQFGLRLSNDRELSRDTIHQLFLYLWEKRASIQPAMNVKAYIVIAFKRLLLQTRKKMLAQQEGLQQALAGGDEAEASAEFNRIMAETELQQQQRLRLAIRQLSPRQQELVLLRFFEGLGYEQIAARTGLQVRTVYNRIHEALERIREMIG